MALDRLLDDIADAGRGFVENRLRVGVTGLSSAGKTVFLTAMVHGLLHPDGLPRLGAVRDGRYHAGVLRPQPNQHLPRFPYEANVAALTGAAGPPVWPPSTDRQAELRLSIRTTPRGLVGRLRDRVLHLDLFDYPGEWLVDLALLQHDYRSWSQALLAELEETPQGPEAAALRGHLAQLDPDAPDADAERHAMQAAQHFRAYMQARQRATGRANLLHPGRFLLPGELEGSPLLTFAPLPPPDGKPPRRRRNAPDSLRRLMRKRFEAYQASVVEPFHRQHFARLDRQIVLVDLVGQIARGGDATARLDREMAAIQTALRIGGGWLPRAVSPGIDRVLFAGSKADQLPQDQHADLTRTLRRALAQNLRHSRFKGAATEVMAVAALRATREVTAGDRPDRRYLAGLPTDGSSEVAHYPGRFADAETAGAGFAPKAFQPPRGLSADRPWPQLHLDDALDYLIGDKL